jgi:hypothetical protein
MQQPDNQQPTDGYPCSMFVATPVDDLKCSICMDVMKEECAAIKAEGTVLMTTVAAVKVECAAVKAENGAMKCDISSLQLYVSILHTSGEEAAAGVMEWVSSRTVPAAGAMREYTYTGQMRGGECFGFGRASWGTGGYESYDGQWKEGKKHGQGILRIGNGDSYEGQWEDDEMHGQGVYKWGSGDSEEGRYEENKRQGPFIRTNADGSRSTRVYEDDVRTSSTLVV